MRIEHVLKAATDWALHTILPQLEWYEQLAAGISLPAMLDKATPMLQKVFTDAGLLAEDGTIDDGQIIERLKQSVFLQRESLPMPVIGHTFQLKLGNIKEILDKAKALAG